jgi:hypothetical protein
MYLHGQLLWHLLSTLAITADVVNAQKPVTRSYCTTSFDKKSTNPVKTKTDYSTKTEKPTVFVTSTPSIITTPPPSTETSVVAVMTTITVTASQITVRSYPPSSLTMCLTCTRILSPAPIRSWSLRRSKLRQ